MKMKVHFAPSPKGIEQVAAIISEHTKQIHEKLPPAYMPEGIALMFIGADKSGVKVVQEFVASLNPSRVANVALFCTSPKKDSAHMEPIAKSLREKGIYVLPGIFTCTGKGVLGGKLPTPEELSLVPEYVKKTMAAVSTRGI